MKKFLKYLFIVVLFSAWGIILTNKDQTHQLVQDARSIVEKQIGIDQPCGKPLTYAIGNIDSRFGITQAQLTDLAQKASNVWNAADGKTMLAYDPSSQFKINLVYDSRQEQSDAARQLESELNSLESTHDVLEKKYGSLSAAYKKKVDEYNKDLADYKNDLENYNKEIEYWNEQGGAPADVYDDLKKEKKDLDSRFSALDKERKDVNNLAGQTNDVAALENKTADKYNNNVTTYKNRYGGSQEFEKGVFDGKEIDIYQFKEGSDLLLTLTHELGHYLGMQHVENTKSIMYYLLGDQNMNNIQPTSEDMAELNKICKK